MQVSVCLGAILIPEYLDSILGILLPDSQNIFRNTFLFRNIPKRTRPKLTKPYTFDQRAICSHLSRHAENKMKTSKRWFWLACEHRRILVGYLKVFRFMRTKYKLINTKLFLKLFHIQCKEIGNNKYYEETTEFEKWQSEISPEYWR